MKKTKQILAILIVIILLGMYIATFIFAMTDNPATMSMFKGCVACTIFVPVAAYAGICLHRYAMNRSKRRNDYSSPVSAHDTGVSDDK